MQGTHSTAVGASAGKTSQGEFAVALGYAAGYANQHKHTTVINATGGALNTGLQEALYVAPIRNDYGTHALRYNPATKEITYY